MDARDDLIWGRARKNGERHIELLQTDGRFDFPVCPAYGQPVFACPWGFA